MKTFVIGHKNPDMDAICSALAYAEFKHVTGDTTAVAARCGNTNERIDYVLHRFGFEPPVFLSDVTPRVEDVMETKVITAQAEEPIFHALSRLRTSRIRGLLPVIDRASRCIGLFSTHKLTDYLLLNEPQPGCTIHASLANIRESLNAEVLAGIPSEQPEIYSLLVAAVAEGSFRSLLESSTLQRTIVVVGDRPRIIEMAAEAGVGALLLTGGSRPAAAALTLCEKKGIAVILTTLDTSSTLIHIRGAIRAHQMLEEKFRALSADLTLEAARRTLALSSQSTFPVLGENGALLGVFSKSDFLKPIPRQLILVDHNELSQAVIGADEIPIVEILDHHRLGSISTEAPILFVNRPVGSTCTIVATSYQTAQQPIPANVAGILMAGLISDTLNLTSPTTTAVDREILDHLAQITNIAPTRLAEEIFSVGSPLLTLTSQQAITADCKEYRERGHTFTISQVEEISFSHFPEKRESLLNALETYRLEHGYLFSALLVTDVNTQNSLLLMRGDENYLNQVDYPTEERFVWQLDGIVSRKKQLLPYLSGLLTISERLIKNNL
ncbi:MAG: inorganic diphosphatase [Verrucomicrobia bacterium]|nr:MAG: inorganic diphosphatase [Verrucomicrobiota bacterium]